MTHIRTRARLRSLALVIACVVSCASLGNVARADTPSATVATDATLTVRGGILAIDGGYVIFTSGDAIRLRAGTTLPARIALGSVVLVTIDRATREVVAMSRDPAPGTDAIAAADLPREYVVVAPKSARAIAVAMPQLGAVAAAGPSVDPSHLRTTVTLDVTVPSNTPPSDDVYVSTDRSRFGPAEIRMQRVDARRFTATVALDANGHLSYQFTRGSYATVERDRSGGIVPPHVVDRSIEKTDDVVTRWADAN